MDLKIHNEHLMHPDIGWFFNELIEISRSKSRFAIAWKSTILFSPTAPKNYENNLLINAGFLYCFKVSADCIVSALSHVFR